MKRSDTREEYNSDQYEWIFFTCTYSGLKPCIIRLPSYVHISYLSLIIIHFLIFIVVLLLMCTRNESECSFTMELEISFLMSGDLFRM